MAQRPTADFNIDPNVTSGTDLANILNRFQDAIDSGNSGASRPAYLDAGGLWVREGDPMRLYLYDGTTDRELYNTTDGLVGASQWKDNGDDIYYDDGNVGINVADPSAKLEVMGPTLLQRGLNAPDRQILTLKNTASSDPSSSYLECRNLSDEPVFTINSTGNVGIGMSPLRQASEAKEQLEDWKSAIEERMKAEPKAGRSAVTQEITGFDKLPTLEQVKERLERAAGDKLQVDGNISASGTVSADKFSSFTMGAGLSDTFTLHGKENPHYGANWSHSGNTPVVISGYYGISFATQGAERFSIAGNGDATFSGTVNASGDFVSTSGIFTRSGAGAGLAFASGGVVFPLLNGATRDNEVSLGSSVTKFKDAYFSGTVTVNGNRPVISTRDLIETLSTLRNATKDEETLEGLRDAIGDAVGGLIQKFEAIQAEAEKAATMDIEE